MPDWLSVPSLLQWFSPQGRIVDRALIISGGNYRAAARNFPESVLTRSGIDMGNLSALVVTGVVPKVRLLTVSRYRTFPVRRWGVIAFFHRVLIAEENGENLRGGGSSVRFDLVRRLSVYVITAWSVYGFENGNATEGDVNEKLQEMFCDSHGCISADRAYDL